MSVREQIVSHIQRLAIPILWIYIPLLTVLIGLAVWAVGAGDDFSFYFLDPAATVNTAPWIGLFSSIGVFLWWFSAVVSIYTAVVLRGVADRRELVRFLMSWGALTGVLAIDDFYMIHEWIIPTYLLLSESALFVVYFMIALALIVRFRDLIIRTPFPVFVFALACFAASIVIDVLGPEQFHAWGLPGRIVWNVEYVVEDGLKLMGIVAWAHYFGVVSYTGLRSRIAGSPEADGIETSQSTDQSSE